jgi:hypothetical protein
MLFLLVTDETALSFESRRVRSDAGKQGSIGNELDERGLVEG